MSIVGFIGLGIMGKPMAMNLLKAGVKLLVNDIDQKTVDCLVTEGATQSQLSELGTNCEVIFTNLPSGSIVHNVLFGENGLAQTIKKGAVVCDLSSVTPMESQTCYKKLKELGVAFLDAPVSGGEPKAPWQMV